MWIIVELQHGRAPLGDDTVPDVLETAILIPLEMTSKEVSKYKAMC